MGAMASVSISGGVKHGLAALSHGELEAAQKALAKLTGSGGGLGSHLGGIIGSATVYGGSGAKTVRTGGPPLLHAQGSDTFIGGARSGLTPATAGNDTVVSGSLAASGGRSPLSQALGHSGQTLSLSSSDTINVAGATAESMRTAQPPGASAHTITLADKTTINISGVPAQDITKIHR